MDSSSHEPNPDHRLERRAHISLHAEPPPIAGDRNIGHVGVTASQSSRRQPNLQRMEEFAQYAHILPDAYIELPLEPLKRRCAYTAGDRNIGHVGATSTQSSNAGRISTDQDSRDLVAIIIEALVQGTPALQSEYCCIYKVPDRFRKGNEEFYKPRVVAIGPFHHNDQSLVYMQKYKPSYVEAFLGRSRLNLDHCVGVVRGWEAKARSYYVEPIELSSDYFVFMMLVDAIFVLELMLRHHFPEYIDTCDPIYRKPKLIEDVWHDMMLIENQLPFFLLKGLYEQMTSHHDHLSFANLTHKFFKHLVRIDQFPHHVSFYEVKHFVDFMRWYYLPSNAGWQNQNNTNNSLNEIPPSVTALEEAGVKFETMMWTTSSATSLLDIEFNNGCLRIPNFVVDDWTETLFRNMIAFEQCHDTEKYISQFVFLMVSMIRTSKDADLLIDHGIISTMLGSGKDVSVLFSKINKDVGFGPPYYYVSICKRLNAYCKIPWNSWKATLKRDYFNTPWKVASTIAAFILLVLTFIQTLCSILGL